MRAQWISRIRRGMGAACVTFVFAAVGMASDRVAVPEGTVIELQTTSSLDSKTAQQGDTFSTTVVRSIYVDGILAIPQASSVDGRVTNARPAVRDSQSGVIGVEFFRLRLPDGTSYDLSGGLTSLKPGERGDNSGRNNVFIGGSGKTVIGALAGGLFGTGSGMLNSLLSAGSEAQLPAGSNIAMQLVNAITITPTDPQTQDPDETNRRTVYTSTRMVRSAQTALHDRDFYNGSINGQLDRQTRQALADFQSQNGQPVTGDLDQQTAAQLGLIGSNQGSEWTDRQLAASIYRKAQSLQKNYESSLGIQVNDIRAGLTSDRLLTEGDLDLLLQANSFSNAAAWYQQATANAPNVEGPRIAAHILESSAQRVEAGLLRTQQNSQFRQQWAGIQSDLNRVGVNNSEDNNSGSVPDYNSGQASSTGHFQWQGLVDGSDNIRLHGSRVDMAHLTAGQVQQATYQLSSALPLSPVQVTLRKVRGRGQILLLEQPTASNNYTAVVQVNDQDAWGSAWYEFTLDW
ncbi:MAG: peptidoglycan-binding protein [Acidobacteriia bacterium]|nr:peptidoglycan-binding protein [Terriglobia bacterium]